MILKPWKVRFWESVVIGNESDCWPWTGAKDKDGYGKFGTTHRRSIVYREIGEHRAHRISWVLAHGAIEKGMCVCHACDQPDCVNPAHLWLGTSQQNTKDRDRKGRAADRRGSANGASKLTLTEVRRIFELAKTGLLSEREIGLVFGVCQTTVSLVLQRKTWSSVA